LLNIFFHYICTIKVREQPQHPITSFYNPEHFKAHKMEHYVLFLAILAVGTLLLTVGPQIANHPKKGQKDSYSSYPEDNFSSGAG